MKAGIIVLTVALSAIVFMAFALGGNLNNYSVMYSSGPPGGYSGDPASGNRNCTSCHSGPEVQSREGWITSNIPVEGYVPESSYTITARAIGIGHTKFGFQVSPQDAAGNFMGTLVNTGTNTKLTSDPNYISQTSTGSNGNDSIDWTFDWTAPAEGSGEVNFYGVFNIANGDGRTSGDTILLSVLNVKELITHTRDISDDGLIISVYPNPASDVLTINGDNSILGSSYHVIDQAGREVLTGKISSINTTVDINQLANGIYYIQVGSQSRTSFKVLKY